jgi:hypothetical protein
VGEDEIVLLLLYLVAMMIQHLVATVGELLLHRISKRGARLTEELHNIT